MSIRVLIVDDSSTMQQILSMILSSDPDIEVVGMAGDAASARTLIKQTNPDVVTLDIEMPGMNGLQFLEKIMSLRPMPVVMISNRTSKGTNASLDALAIGAFACLAKPKLNDTAGTAELLRTIKSAAGATLNRRVVDRPAAVPSKECKTSQVISDPSVIAVGASTGGVEALNALFLNWPPDCPPTIVVQHMPAGFTTSLANRLDQLCPPTVTEAKDFTNLEKGNVYIAPGSVGHTTLKNSDRLRISIRPGEDVSGHTPSVDELFRSTADVVGSKAVGILLTGMGSDGAAGLLAMKDKGATTITQDAASCLVHGMPAAADKLNAAVWTMAPEEMGGRLFRAYE